MQQDSAQTKKQRSPSPPRWQGDPDSELQCLWACGFLLLILTLNFKSLQLSIIDYRETKQKQMMGTSEPDDCSFVWDENSQLYFHARFFLYYSKTQPLSIFFFFFCSYINLGFSNCQKDFIFGQIKVFQYLCILKVCCLVISCGPSIHL